MMELSRHSFFSNGEYLPVYRIYDFVERMEKIPTLEMIATQYDLIVAYKMNDIEWRTNPSGARERHWNKWHDVESLEPAIYSNVKELIGMEPSMSTETLSAALQYGNMSYINMEDEFINEPLRGIW